MSKESQTLAWSTSSNSIKLGLISFSKLQIESYATNNLLWKETDINTSPSNIPTRYPHTGPGFISQYLLYFHKKLGLFCPQSGAGRDTWYIDFHQDLLAKGRQTPQKNELLHWKHWDILATLMLLCYAFSVCLLRSVWLCFRSKWW